MELGSDIARLLTRSLLTAGRDSGNVYLVDVPDDANASIIAYELDHHLMNSWQNLMGEPLCTVQLSCIKIATGRELLVETNTAAEDHNLVHILGVTPEWLLRIDNILSTTNVISMNNNREAFHGIKCQKIFWLTATTISTLATHAPDMFSWRSGIYKAQTVCHMIENSTL